MAAFVAGDAKRANPIPTMIRLKIIEYRGVFPFKKVNEKRPTVVIDIPIDAILRVSIFSDILPAKGDKIATESGCKTNIIPAAFGLSSLRY